MVVGVEWIAAIRIQLMLQREVVFTDFSLKVTAASCLFNDKEQNQGEKLWILLRAPKTQPISSYRDSDSLASVTI